MIPTSRDSQNRGDPPAGRSPSAPAQTPPPDPRLTTFGAYIAAVDQSDVSGVLSASRTLRKLGISVVATGTLGKADGR